MYALKSIDKRSSLNKNRGVRHPLPMQYLGSKSRIAEWIIDQTEQKYGTNRLFIDLFAGTGSVALSAFNRGYNVVCNDVQPYSHQVLKTLFQTPRNGIDNLKSKVLNLNGSILVGREKYKSILNQEIAFFDDKRLLSNWKEYAKFSKSVAEENIICPNEIDKKNYNLFISYYANTYFGIKQCLQIDKIRELADSLENENLKDLLLGTTISVLTFTVTGTTHLAQFLKPNTKESVKKIVNCRKIDIIDLVVKRLLTLGKYELRNYHTDVYNLDFKDSFKEMNVQAGDIIYADPPYFKEHYSRYYHILDTFLLYDYPDLTMNKITGEVTSGLYRDKRIVSDFGLKSSVAEAFDILLKFVKEKNLKLVLSYASSSIYEQENLYELISKNNLSVSTEHVDLTHSSQGNGSNKQVNEYLYLIN